MNEILNKYMGIYCFEDSDDAKGGGLYGFQMFDFPVGSHPLAWL